MDINTITSSQHSNCYCSVTEKKSESAELSFTETALAGSALATKTEFCSPEPKQSQRSCHLCKKTNLDGSEGCFNPSVFSPAVGDWICNANMELSR